MTAKAGAASGITTADLESFLYHEADLLDSWRLEDWLGLFLPDATYDAPDGSPHTALHFVADTMVVLKGRVNRLKSPDGYAESPPARTRRLISNVRRIETGDETIRLAANFMIARMKKGARTCSSDTTTIS